MPMIFPSSSLPVSSSVSSASSDTENPDVWFDAIDHVDMDKDWFDVENHANGDSWSDVQAKSLSIGHAATGKVEEPIPFTEDCRRCIKELIRHWGAVKESEILFAGLSRVFPGLPADLLVAAHSLYVAGTKRRDVDLAVLNTLGLASSYWLVDGNAIATAANLIRENILEYVGQSYVGQFLSEDDQHSSYLFTALAVLAIAARHWITDEMAPQRRMLRVPAFLGNLLLRISSYWNHLGQLAQRAAATCRIALADSAVPQTYLCTEQINRVAVRHPPVIQQKSWLCVRIENPVEMTARQPLCPFVREPDGPRPIAWREEVKTSGAANSAAPGVDAGRSLLTAAASTAVAASRPATRWRSGVIRGAVAAFSGTVALVGGKLIRDTLFAGSDKDNRRSEDAESQTPQAFALSDDDNHGVVRDAASHTAYITISSPEPIFLRRLIGYLHAIEPFSSHETSSHDLARAALRLLRQDKKYQTDLAHIALYGSGLFGEKHEEYLDPAVEKLLVGDLLSKLLFDYLSLEDYVLKKFSLNRRISAKDFQKKIVDWPFENEDAELKVFFNEQFLFPVMAIFNVKLKEDDPNDENHLVLVGSPTWFFTYIGAQFMSSAIEYQGKEKSVDDMTTYGVYIYRMLRYGQLVDGSRQVIAPGVKLAGLFLNPEWTPETLPDLQQVEDLVAMHLRWRIRNDTSMVQEFNAVMSELEKTAEEPWYSRGKMAEQLLLKHCGNVNVPLYRYLMVRKSVNSDQPPQKKMIMIRRSWMSAVSILKEIDQHAYCYNSRGLIIKIPTVNYRYRNAIISFVKTLKRADLALLGKLFSGSDLFSADFSYDDYAFINRASLTEINVAIGRARDIREILAFGAVVQTWKPPDEYLFFNATYQGETRSYITRRVNHDYWIKKLDLNHLVRDLKPFFNKWPPDTITTLTVVLSADKDSIKTTETEPISIFIEKLAEKRFRNTEKILYDAGYETPILEVISAFLKDVFIPFYSCITSLQKADADGAVVSCVLDGALTLAPFMKGGILIVSRSIKSSSKKILIRLAKFPDFVASPGVIRKNTISLKNVIPAADIYTTAETLALGKSAVSLIAEALDPGVVLIGKSKKMFFEVGKILVSGNILKMSTQITKHGRHVVEASVRVKSLTDSRKILVGISRITNRGGDFDTEFDYPADPIKVNHNNNTHFISLVYHEGGYYNVFHISKSKIDILAGETGEISNNGAKIYAMLSAHTPTGIFIKYICSEADMTACELTPWLPPVVKAEIIQPSRMVSLRNGERWIFDDTKHSPKPSVYPDHQVEIFQEGYTSSKLYEIFEVDAIHYLYDPSNPYFRPLHAGDNFTIVPRRDHDYILSFKRNRAGSIVIARFNKTPGKWQKRAVSFLEKKYAIRNSSCVQSEGIILDANDRLIAHIQKRCYPLKLSSIRNRFLIDSIHVELPSFKVGWSSKENQLIPVKPYLGESSVHAGTALEEFVSRQGEYCQGSEIKKLPTELISGAVTHAGNAWLKLMGRYYRLGPWREGIFPLYCSNTNLTVAWLRYDLFTESFDLVHEGDDWGAAIEAQNESAFEKLVRQIFKDDPWTSLTRNNARSPLMLRLRQVAFLQDLDDADRMELLSLPVAHVRSWPLHVDAVSLRNEYPALALGQSQHHQMAGLMSGMFPNSMRFLNRRPLNNDMISTAGVQGKLIAGGNGDHEAVWLDNGADVSTSGMLLKLHERNFYGEHIVSNDGKIKWMPGFQYAPAISVIQFMQEIRFRPEPLTDLYRKNIWIYHPEWGELPLRRSDQESRIDYVFISQGGDWAGLIDAEKYISLFLMRNLSGHVGSDAESGMSAASRQRLPVDLQPEDFSLCFVSDNGEFYYPGKFTWNKLTDHHALWAPPPGFVPVFITPDQRFLGFQEPNRCGVLIYDRQRKRQVFLRRPAGGESGQSISAVAFSPLNAFAAFAFSDGHVYLYDFVDKTCSAALDPIAHVELAPLRYVSRIASHPQQQMIVMRFQGFFRYLTVIYDARTGNPDSARNSNNFVYDIYELSPSVIAEKGSVDTREDELTTLPPVQ